MNLSAQREKVGQIVQVAGAAAFAAGILLSVQHHAIAALLVGGALAYAAGKTLRSS